MYFNSDCDYCKSEATKIEERLEDFKNTQTALKRLPTGKEVADFCFYLTSDQASAVTGQCINVDCGVLPQ